MHSAAIERRIEIVALDFPDDAVQNMASSTSGPGSKPLQVSPSGAMLERGPARIAVLFIVSWRKHKPGTSIRRQGG